VHNDTWLLSKARLHRHLFYVPSITSYNLKGNGRYLLIREAVREAVIVPLILEPSTTGASPLVPPAYQVADHPPAPNQGEITGVVPEAGTVSNHGDNLYYQLHPDFRPLQPSQRPFRLPHLQRYFGRTAGSLRAATIAIELQILVYIFQIYNVQGQRKVDGQSIR